MGNVSAVHYGKFGRAVLTTVDRALPVHAHRQGQLLFLVEGGEGRITYDGHYFGISETLGAAINPWQTHSLTLLDADRPCLVLSLLIEPLWFHEVSELAAFPFGFGSGSVEMTMQMSLWVRRLAAMMMNGEKPEALEDCLYDMTYDCYTQSWENAPAAVQRARAQANVSDALVRRSLHLLEQRAFQTGSPVQLTVDIVADALGLTRPDFIRLFRRHMGVEPTLFLNTLCAERAIEELTGTEKPLEEISADLGFVSEESFSRFFASNIGIPPTEYRRASSEV